MDCTPRVPPKCWRRKQGFQIKFYSEKGSESAFLPLDLAEILQNIRKFNVEWMFGIMHESEELSPMQNCKWRTVAKVICYLELISTLFHGMLLLRLVLSSYHASTHAMENPILIYLELVTIIQPTAAVVLLRALSVKDPEPDDCIKATKCYLNTSCFLIFIHILILCTILIGPSLRISFHPQIDNELLFLMVTDLCLSTLFRIIVFAIVWRCLHAFKNILNESHRVAGDEILSLTSFSMEPNVPPEMGDPLRSSLSPHEIRINYVPNIPSSPPISYPPPPPYSQVSQMPRISSLESLPPPYSEVIEEK